MNAQEWRDRYALAAVMNKDEVGRLIADFAAMEKLAIGGDGETHYYYRDLAESAVANCAKERERAEAAEKELARLRDTLDEYGSHQSPCLLTQWHEGRPRDDGGYKTRFLTPQAQAIFAAALAAPQGEERYPPRPAPADGALTRENIINILDEESADISKSVSSEDIADRILALFDEEWMEVQAKLTDAVRERDEWKGMASRGATTNVEYMALMEKANDERDHYQRTVARMDEELEKIEIALSTPTAPVDHGSRVLQKMIDEASAKDNSVVRRQCANGHPCDEQWIRCPECGLEAHDMVVG